MASNITDHEFLTAEPSLPEPHFDEEATVLSARPVVPLDAIKGHSSFRRPLVFGLAVAGALLLGIAATAFYFSRQTSNTSTAFADPEAIASGAQAAAIREERGEEFRPAVNEAAAVPVAPATARIEVPPAEPRSDSPAKSSKKPVARLFDVITPNASYSEKRIREERKAARQEEKQRKREARRERDNQSPDDLLRIREIFEGRRKP